MLQALRSTVWFIWKSWSYLGCDHGTARWRRRREYAVGVLPRAVVFYRLARADQ